MAVILPAPPYQVAMVDGTGRLSTAWRPFFQDLYRMLYGGGVDKVDAAYELAMAACPADAVVVAVAGLQFGGAIGPNAAVGLYAVECAVASLPSRSREGDWAYAQDGRKPGEGAGSGTGVPCFFSGSSWIAVTSGAAVTA